MRPFQCSSDTKLVYKEKDTYETKHYKTNQTEKWNETNVRMENTCMLNTFNLNKGRIQEILKAHPEIEQKRKANQSRAITLMNQAGHKYDAYYEYAEKTGFTEAWIDCIAEANVSDPAIQMFLGQELLRQHITTIGLAGYHEAKNGWVFDNTLCRERMALIKFLLQDSQLPPFPPRVYKTKLYRRRKNNEGR